ncbi:MAG: long-chain fatty acid--CoA ligase [Ruminococcaceae bacterium]|nr:long-chain fatty acid--CoA ligase [Oscillospiraceae bacterium]
MGHKVPQVHDFRHLVYSSAKRFGNKNAFVLRDRNVSYFEFCLEYKYLTTYFLSCGLKNKRIAVVGANSYGWILAYLAASTVGVSVPIDKELSSEDILNFMNEAECSLVVGDSSILKGLETDARKIAFCENKQGFDVLPKLIKKGEKLYTDGFREIDSMKIDAEKMSILIFTSGTTGNSKGVCLSQKNICANINQTAKMVKIDDLHSLSVLPLHHTYETTLGHMLLLSGGACISYSDGLRYVAKNISEYRPSVLIVVPLLLEFILRRIETSIRESLPIKLLLPEGASVSEIIAHLPFPIRFIVKKKVKKSLGGRLRLLIVGAAPIKPETIEAFQALGIATYQGYGLTECSPLLAGNNDFFVNPAAVGLPIHGVEIKIENPNDEGVGEVIAKGDNIMLGYFNDPEETAKVMRGGYFHTGDMGRIDEDGFLYLTGRCKSVIVTQNGKNIYPEELEERLCSERFIAEALVLGVDNEKGGVAVKAKIYPFMDKLKEEYGKEPSKEEIKKTISELVEKINDKLPSYKKITVLEIVEEAFEKTTTKKIKRFGNNIL